MSSLCSALETSSLLLLSGRPRPSRMVTPETDPSLTPHMQFLSQTSGEEQIFRFWGFADTWFMTTGNSHFELGADGI